MCFRCHSYSSQYRHGHRLIRINAKSCKVNGKADIQARGRVEAVSLATVWVTLSGTPNYITYFANFIVRVYMMYRCGSGSRDGQPWSKPQRQSSLRRIAYNCRMRMFIMVLRNVKRSYPQRVQTVFILSQINSQSFTVILSWNTHFRTTDMRNSVAMLSCSWFSCMCVCVCVCVSRMECTQTHTHYTYSSVELSVQRFFFKISSHVSLFGFIFGSLTSCC
jgi:hypothetical protein